MKPALPTLPLILLLVAAPAVAQELAAPRFDAAMLAAPASVDLPGVATPMAPVDRRSAGHTGSDAAAAESTGGFSMKPILHALGGAVIGGWVGYVGAQVVKSDWDKSDNSAFTGQRSTWVAAGAAVGVIGAWLIGETRPPRPDPFPVDRPSPRDRSTISDVEIRESGLRTALEVVTALRREWLQTRGTNSWGETALGTASGMGSSAQTNVRPGRDKIIVYLDGIRVGGVEDMTDIDANSLTSIRFLDARQATYLYGSGHAHGAIILSTEPEIP